MDPQAVYEQNRGIWVLGARADRERYAIFSDTTKGLIRCVVEITDIENAGAKRAIVGDVLAPGHPVHDALIGKQAPDNFRNPVTYPPDPGASLTCACGCGASVSGRSQFLAGHDQRAVHSRIASRWGGALAFIEWFDSTYGRPGAST
ncbi:hypothetical protein [Modestobacter altitudinis]|uniref:hypothetical protein n=1 Tax=Modestobacter altitudinis TaxID=2213158 RepID=UPI00110CB728|nr:hypothetical protein [Modestobacter altitudinis]